MPGPPHVAARFSTPGLPDTSPQVDMARTEELTTKYKTLAYDHERLVAQHTLALTTAATSERDVETAKARMDSMLKRLAAEEEAHRKSRDEFQKVKSSMQYLRQTTANELKRKEKEVEKMVERLGKMSNDQIKLGTVGAGLACTNLLPNNPLPQVRTENQWLGTSHSYICRISTTSTRLSVNPRLLGWHCSRKTMLSVTLSSLAQTPFNPCTTQRWRL